MAGEGGRKMEERVGEIERKLEKGRIFCLSVEVVSCFNLLCCRLIGRLEGNWTREGSF